MNQGNSPPRPVLSDSSPADAHQRADSCPNEKHTGRLVQSIDHKAATHRLRDSPDMGLS